MKECHGIDIYCLKVKTTVQKLKKKTIIVKNEDDCCLKMKESLVIDIDCLKMKTTVQK